MYIRESKTVANGKTYHYRQLAESYRNENGTPATRVLANLNHLSDREIENLRAALKASSEGKRVAVGSAIHPPKPEANLVYLPLAALIELWRRSGLSAMIEDVLPQGDHVVSPADVTLALVLNRCVAPRSKVAATQWFTETALPELLDVDTASFTNTRLHRVLATLAEQTPVIMRRLPGLYLDQCPAFSSLFIDLTDATFEGEGPEKARKGRCKDDTIRQKVGICLLCNERGYPLRWQVVEGNKAEAPVMIGQMREVSRTTWAKDVPIVGDRALGHTAYVRELLTSNVRFVTAIVRNELRAYAPGVDFDELGMNEVSEDGGHTQWLAEAGFARDSDDLFFRDLGLVTRTTTAQDTKMVAPASAADTSGPQNRVATALELAIAIIKDRDTGVAATYNDAATARGLPIASATKYRGLVRLTTALQAEVLAGAASGISLVKVLAVAKLAQADQRAAFDDLRRKRDDGALVQLVPFAQPNLRPNHEQPVEVRVVVYFNPQMRTQQRQRHHDKLEKTRTYVDELNRAALTGTSNRTGAKMYAAAIAKLKKFGLLKVCDVEWGEPKKGAHNEMVPQLQLQLNNAGWSRRRALDGISVLVAHPEIEIDAAALCRLYRAKDTVEKDFQTIKSVVQMLPIRHRTDPKVTAHITLCVLALALERMLRDALNGAMSASQALAILGTCHLNRYGTSADDRAYLTTTATAQQTKLLRKLKMLHLADDDQMAERIHPK